MSKYIRLNITTEGQTEFRFVNNVLYRHLQPFGIYCDKRSVLTSKEYKKRGGMTNYVKAKNDILQWIKQESQPDRRFTTMFDFYALPDDFPGFSNAKETTDPYQKVECIEKALAEDIGDYRFIPYIQLHEFEALIFSDLDTLLLEYENKKSEVQMLKSILSNPPYDNNPELINDKRQTSPSHRIIQLIPEYQKNSSGSLIAELISVSTLRQKCRHFNEWLTQLENI